MKKTFQDGVDAIYNALVAAGATPPSKTPADMANKIQTTILNYKLPSTLTVRSSGGISLNSAGSSWNGYLDVSVTGYGSTRLISKGGPGYGAGYADHTATFTNLAVLSKQGNVSSSRVTITVSGSLSINGAGLDVYSSGVTVSIDGIGSVYAGTNKWSQGGTGYTDHTVSLYGTTTVTVS